MAGIIKAGDGGSGARARDGEGGNDSSNGAPYNGTSGDYNTATDADEKPIYFGGDKGSQGDVYYFGAKEIGNTEEDITNESKVIESSDGKQGSRGNDGWGGVNLSKYEYIEINDTLSYGIGTVKGNLTRTRETFTVQFNATRSNFNESIPVEILFRLGSDYEEDALTPLVWRNSREELYKVQICFDKDYYGGTFEYTVDWTKLCLDDERDYNLIYSTKGEIHSDIFMYYIGPFGKYEALQTVFYVYSNLTSAEC